MDAGRLEVLKSLRIVSLPGRNPSESTMKDYLAAYAMWRTVWAETFRELDGTPKIYSDEFTRQDEVLCIFRGDVCLASGVLRWVNLGLVSDREDSYFAIWPESAIHTLWSRGPNVIVMSNVSVHPLVRRGRLGISLKDVMIALLVERMVEAKADAMTGTPRTDRNMHTTLYRSGAETLAANVIHHNVPIHIVGFFPEKVHPSTDPVVAEAVEFLWKFRREGQPRATSLRAA